VQRDTQQDPQAAEHDERQAPAVVLADQSRKNAATDRPDVDARLVQPHRTRARVTAVIVADERHRRRKVEGFSESFRRTEEEQVAEVPRKRRRQADHAPYVQAAEDGGLPPDAVDHHPCERRREAVNPREGRTEKPQLDRRQVHLTLEEGEHRENGLPVGVVTDADRPEHQDDPPFVARVDGHRRARPWRLAAGGPKCLHRFERGFGYYYMHFVGYIRLRELPPSHNSGGRTRRLKKGHA